MYEVSELVRPLNAQNFHVQSNTRNIETTEAFAKDVDKGHTHTHKNIQRNLARPKVGMAGRTTRTFHHTLRQSDHSCTRNVSSKAICLF